LAHDYPDDPELRTSAINRFVKGATNLSALFQQVNSYIAQHFPQVG